ncbi:ELKS/Rab6-interacting/CAST family member 1-like [Boleophthalmus pectinirostris]|uniref:ELKS/Rab6-interacting/CAST family member 1-like n=1 Tax=Boleophthalmus pectinirostris TaxID=150288 RepID=UPI00242C8E44|nr:ELKS/Rab6-interacting/CAST family member 1-like [Boleophthalmus pectinirostris]
MASKPEFKRKEQNPEAPLLNRRERRRQGRAQLQEAGQTYHQDNLLVLPEAPEAQKQEENQASQVDLLQQIQMLKAQLRLEQEEREKEKALHERSRVYAENLQKQIQRLKKEKASAFSKQKEEARMELQEEIKRQANANSFLRGQLEQVNRKAEGKAQYLLDNIARKDEQEKDLRAQITALTQELEKEQVEKQNLVHLVAELKSSLNEKKQAPATAESRADVLETFWKEKEELMAEVSVLRRALTQEQRASKKALCQLELQQSVNNVLTMDGSTLKFALAEKQSSVRELQDQLEAVERNNQLLTTEVTGLRSALIEEQKNHQQVQAKLQTLQDEKRGLESTVAALRSTLTEERHSIGVLRSGDKDQIITEQKAKAHALNQSLQTERVTFKAVIEQCHAAYASVLRQKDQLIQQVRDTHQEMEKLRVQHRSELSALQGSEEQKRNTLQEKIQELSAALTSSEEMNSALKRQNQVLLDIMETKEEEAKETISRLKRRRWFSCFT